MESRLLLRRLLLAAGVLGMVGSAGVCAPAAAPAGDAAKAAAPVFLNVAAVQTELRFYRTAEDFETHMAQRVASAMLQRPDLVVLPEGIGLALVALGDYETATSAGTLQRALARLASKHRSEVKGISRRYQTSSTRALWLFRAAAIRRAYEGTFSQLARRHKVHIVAGSVPLVFPDEPADVYSTCCLFSPDGKMHVLGRKMNLLDAESVLFEFSRGTLEQLQAYQMPQGTLGVVASGDGLNPDAAQRLVAQGADLLIQVSANPETWTSKMRKEWSFGLVSRVQDVGRYGISCMGVGKLLEFRCEGQSQILAPKEWTRGGTGILAETHGADTEEVVAARLDLSRTRANR